MNRITKKYKNGFFVDLVDYYDEFANNGWYTNSEIQTQDWIIDNAKPDWISFDCGAHIGYYSMLLSHMSPQGKVIAFEVCRESVIKMNNNIDYNIDTYQRNFNNIFIAETALGDKRGMFKETVWQTGITAGNYGETQGEFSFDTLDNFSKTINLNKLDFIKIDCDGWDFEVLTGGEEVIKKFKPSIVMEINALHWRDHKAEDYFKYVDYLGYNYLQIDDINMLLTQRIT